jgi:hypothetical protein
MITKMDQHHTSRFDALPRVAAASRLGSSSALQTRRSPGGVAAMESFEELLDASWCSFRRKLLEALGPWGPLGSWFVDELGM